MFVWVYKYRYWDAERSTLETSGQYFTVEAIRAGLGMAIIESGMKVTLAEVDDFGRLKTRSIAGIPPYAEERPSRDRSS
jgi:hypothetical protein